MALYGAFSSAMLGMMAQARSLQTISTNISNVNTGGFKRSDTQFSTLLGNQLGNNSDLGGVRPVEKSNITKQGNIIASNLATDVAINGRGFFVLNSKQDGTGETLYTRDGSMQIQSVNNISVTGIGGTSVTTKDGYLADKNGYFVQGWAYQNGVENSTGTPTSLRVDQFAFINQFQQTTTAKLALNLPAGDAVGKSNAYDIGLYDSIGARQSAQLNFTKTGIKAWNVTTTTSRTPVAQVDTVILGGTAGEAGDQYSVSVNGYGKTYTTNGTEANIDAIRDALVNEINADPQLSAIVTAAAAGTGGLTLTAKSAGNALTSTVGATNGGATSDNTASVTTTTANVTNTVTGAATALTFKSDGTIDSPTTLPLTLTFAGGGTANVNLDLAKLTQYYGTFLPISYTKDGFGAASMKSFSFDAVGNVVGAFDDNSSRNVYKLSLGVFDNANALGMKNGNVFTPTKESGSAKLTTAGSTGYASFTPNAKELSNVDMAKEFSKMMVTQTAYNAASNVLRTADQMTTVARDLKR